MSEATKRRQVWLLLVAVSLPMLNASALADCSGRCRARWPRGSLPS